LSKPPPLRSYIHNSPQSINTPPQNPRKSIHRSMHRLQAVYSNSREEVTDNSGQSVLKTVDKFHREASALSTARTTLLRHPLLSFPTISSERGITTFLSFLRRQESIHFLSFPTISSERGIGRRHCTAQMFIQYRSPLATFSIDGLYRESSLCLLLSIPPLEKACRGEAMRSPKASA